jgi:alpha-1,6-mannosyltransferase
VTKKALLVLGIPSVALWCGLAALGDLTHRIPAFLAVYGALFLLYALLLRRSRWGAAVRGRSLRAALLLALAFRLAALAAPPSLSADLQRYLWDGRVLLSGANPFRHSPQDPELAPLRDAHWPALHEQTLPTIYPATAQLVFAGAALVWPKPSGIKLAMGLMELLSLAALARLLAARGRPPGQILIAAWNPLPILEFWGTGHMDAIGIAAMMLALWALARERHRLAHLALGAAILAKLLPLVLVPSFLRATARRTWFVLVATVAVGVAVFLGPGIDALQSLRLFVAKWRGNDVAFAGLVWALGSLWAAKVAGALVLAGLVGWTLARRMAAAETALLLITAVLVLSPVLHPWYLTWIVPLLAFSPSVVLVGWTGSIALAYTAWSRYHAAGEYAVVPFVRGIEVMLPLAAGCIACVRGFRLMLPRVRRAPEAG